MSNSPTLTLDPERTLTILVDPQKGFADTEGSFARAFGKKELLHIDAALRRAQKFVKGLPRGVNVAYLRSEYQPGQFNDDRRHPLYNLCVPKNNPSDCEWARGVKPSDEAVIFTKQTNNATENFEFSRWLREEIRDRVQHVILGGCTTTTCIKESAIGTMEIANAMSWRSLQVIVPKNIVGCRVSKYRITHENKPTPIDLAIQEMRARGVVILDSIEQIEWATRQK